MEVPTIEQGPPVRCEQTARGDSNARGLGDYGYTVLPDPGSQLGTRTTTTSPRCPLLVRVGLLAVLGRVDSDSLALPGPDKPSGLEALGGAALSARHEHPPHQRRSASRLQDLTETSTSHSRQLWSRRASGGGFFAELVCLAHSPLPERFRPSALGERSDPRDLHGALALGHRANVKPIEDGEKCNSMPAADTAGG